MDLRYAQDTLRRLDERTDLAAGTQQQYAFDTAGRLAQTSFLRILQAECEYHEDYGWFCSQPDSTLDSTHTFSYDLVGNRTDLGAVLDVRVR